LNRKIDEYQKKCKLRIDSLRDKISELGFTVEKHIDDPS